MEKNTPPRVKCWGGGGAVLLPLVLKALNVKETLKSDCQNILDQNEQPSVRKLGKNQRPWVLQQDNDPKETPKSTKKMHKQETLNHASHKSLRITTTGRGPCDAIGERDREAPCFCGRGNPHAVFLFDQVGCLHCLSVDSWKACPVRAPGSACTPAWAPCTRSPPPTHKDWDGMLCPFPHD